VVSHPVVPKGLEVMLQDCIRARLVWGQGREPGQIIARLQTPDGLVVVFPSGLGFIPISLPGAKPRFSQPNVGDEEECVLKVTTKGNSYHAFPLGGLELKENVGTFVLPSREDQTVPDVVVTPMYPANCCTWKEGNVTYIAIVPKS